ncbi:alpha-glucoside transport system permease protein [Streptomyces sp. SAI-208]|uniref:carbohydrate ABC transporter permease n=1 Tax=unclassified Streptomyces TaxID=2593676 RepID=UPI0024735486|nr:MULTISPECIES: sugar ABC transporter permease [unclassified Streptomyces]MDH6518682.1 alpha-glucoside transport system permease protein [Streptomyces sp. SAI-090]MDH6550903.1 alpha-glucoside transport system permease protein [Streptomyces sp. SAI-041]MDH6569965.1 alpha-glucoside transport system permease protein [Streptomyces sp. SAI-117]MDH6585061.1 alpha-glucoside transport system permease protein [Streptomyces sp. SAI-133]MDH6609529.1 alpha-glucoside transport system permease protein [Str
MTSATEAGVPPAPASPKSRKSVTGTRRTVAALFLLPALLLLGALVVYPIGYSIVRSFYDQSGDGFAGIDNYKALFTDDGIRTALKNNIIWVVFAPTVATALGLIFAVLTERVRWGTAFKLVVFMPMAISMLAAGIIFRLVYDQDPDKGFANAVWVGVHDTFAQSSAFPKAHPGRDSPLVAQGGGFITKAPVHTGGTVTLPLVGVAPDQMPGDAKKAVAPQADPGRITGTTWQDFTRGKGVGKLGGVDPSELGYPGMKIEAVKDGKVVETTKAGDDGTFSFSEKADGALLRLPAGNFKEAYNGLDWLGPSLVTPSIIGAYIWMWAGFAMVLIAAGLAGIPRELLEAARVDGASEWQVFRRVTVPLLAPVLAVVTVTLMINVLKIFDLVFIIAPGSSQDDANVLALELYRKGFAEDQPGIASAISVFLLLLVIPVMWFNIRRLRREVRR